MSSFANGTTVPVEKSRAEIEATIMRFGASEYASMVSLERKLAIIGFKYQGVQIRMELPLPDPKDPRFLKDGRGTYSPRGAEERFEAERRRRWRCLALSLKAKLVAVEDKVATFEREFLPYMVTQTGRTVHEEMAASIEVAKAGRGLLALPAAPALPPGEE